MIFHLKQAIELPRIEHRGQITQMAAFELRQLHARLSDFLCKTADFAAVRRFFHRFKREIVFQIPERLPNRLNLLEKASPQLDHFPLLRVTQAENLFYILKILTILTCMPGIRALAITTAVNLTRDAWPHAWCRRNVIGGEHRASASQKPRDEGSHHKLLFHRCSFIICSLRGALNSFVGILFNPCDDATRTIPALIGIFFRNENCDDNADDQEKMNRDPNPERNAYGKRR